MLSLDPEHHAARDLKDDVTRAIDAERRKRDAEREAERRQEGIRTALAEFNRAKTHDDAIAALERVLAIDPSHTKAHRLLDERTDARAREEAARQADEAVATVVTRARFLADIGRGDDAARLLADVEATHAGSAALERWRGTIAELRERLPAAGAQPGEPVEDTGKMSGSTLEKLSQETLARGQKDAAQRKPSDAVRAASRRLPFKASPRMLAAVGAGAIVIAVIVWALSGRPAAPVAETSPAAPAAQAPATPVSSPPVNPSPETVEPPSIVPSDSPAPAADSAGATAGALEEATRLRAQGRDLAALRLVVAAVDPHDPAPDLLTMINTIIVSAARKAAASRSAAEAVPGHDNAAFRDGLTAERQGVALRRTSRYEEAFQAFVTAADHFTEARDQAAATPATSPQPPPANTPPPATPPPPAEPPRRTPEAPPAPPPPQSTQNASLRPSILASLQFYGQAYGRFDLRTVRAIYPGLPQERQKHLEESRQVCAALQMTFSEIEWVRVEPTSAEVRATTTYNCTTRAGQRVPQSVREQFEIGLRGDRWQINGITTVHR